MNVVSYHEIGDHLQVDVIHSIDPLLHVQSDKELHDAQSATL